MAGARRILPDRGYRDCLGSQQVPWVETWTDDLWVGGIHWSELPVDGSRLTGSITPARISQLAPTVFLTGAADRTLAAISADAALGASDPVGRINAGGSLIQGSKIANSSLSPNALRSDVELAHLFMIGSGGRLESDNYSAGVVGFTIGPDGVEFNLGTWRGAVVGTINIASKFRVDAAGNALWGDAVAEPTKQLGIDATGRLWSGSDQYAFAPFQVDSVGNFYLADNTESLSFVSPGAVNDTILGANPSQAGGQITGNLTLTPRTRGSRIYYTLDGTDPTSSGTRVKYTVPFAVGATVGNPVTVKVAARKMGEYSTIDTWVFASTDATGVAAPVFNPPPDVYFANHGHKDITITCGTSGATIKYTVDGTTPGAGNGTVYSGPVRIFEGETTLKGIGIKAGLSNSAVTSGDYEIVTGGGGGFGGSP